MNLLDSLKRYTTVMLATDSGRTALALSNRRPPAAILTVTRTEPIARTLAVCWGVTAVVQPEAASPEQELAFAIDRAQSRRAAAPSSTSCSCSGRCPVRAAAGACSPASWAETVRRAGIPLTSAYHPPHPKGGLR